MTARLESGRGAGHAQGAPRFCPASGPVAALLLALVATACEEAEIPQGFVDGDPQLGAALIREHGCASCHTIPGVRGADGIVGPSLREFAPRTYLGGVHPNTPETLVRWIMDAPAMSPETAMPDMNVPDDQARHIAAYLYTLR